MIKLVDYIEEKNKILNENINFQTKINIAVLRSYTCENMEPILTTMLLKNNIKADIIFGGFNQYYQEIIDNNSFLYNSNVDIVILLVRPEDIFASIFENYEEIENNIEKVKNEFISKYKNMVEKLQEISSIKSIIISTIEEYEHEINGILDYTKRNSVFYFLKKINLELIYIVNQYKNVYLLDMNKIIYKLGFEKVYNDKMKYLSKDPFQIDVYVEMSKMLNRIIGALYYRTKKLIILDLDNTLYGGVLGEDGIDKIKISEEYPGICYKKFQKALKQLKERGFLLAIVSKNNENNVKKLLNSDKMILKENDFVSIKANWQDKYINIRTIINELNIGLDSVVFIDDSDYELQYVKREIPEIEIIKIPDNILKISNLLEELNFFDKISVTKEDRNKTFLYNVKKISDNNIEKLDEFLMNLNMQIDFKILNENDVEIERATEMTLKTNQFNMATKRYTLADMKKIIENNQKIVILMEVRDKFGEYGNVGLSILDINNDVYYIDSFLLSCRVLKRKLEFCMLEYITELAKKNNIKKIVAEYIPTEKNKFFSNFYESAGFTFIDGKYEFDVTNTIKNVPKYIKCCN